MTRFVVRPPDIMTTPRLLAQALGAQTRRADSTRLRVPFDFNNDFLLYYPDNILNAPQSYGDLRAFARSNKYRQRRIISGPTGGPGGGAANAPDAAGLAERGAAEAYRADAAGLPTPACAASRAEATASLPEDGRFIVRPLRHRGGEGYRVTSSRTDFEEGREYISLLFPKKHEYRIIVCKGDVICTLIKKVPEGLDMEQPWNHANGSTFVTVNNEENNRLRHTDIYQRIVRHPIIKIAHLVGVDVLYRRRQYVVTELNFCPALTIEDNLRKVAEHAQAA